MKISELDEFPANAVRPFLPDRASKDSWLDEVTMPKEGLYGTRGDFFRFTLNTKAVTKFAKRKGISKSLAAPMRFSRKVDKLFAKDRFGQAIGVDCMGGRLSFFSVCRKWGFSASEKVNYSGSFNCIMHRYQAEILTRFFDNFDGINVEMREGELVLKGNSSRGEGCIEIRVFRELNFFPSSTICRGDFSRDLEEAFVMALPKASFLSTEGGKTMLNKKDLGGTKPVEIFKKNFDGHVASTAYSCDGEGTCSLSFTGASFPICFSWAGDSGAELIFCCS
jgi:hypothetical protein